MRKPRIRHLWLFTLLADFAAVAAAYYTTFLLRFHSDSGGHFFTTVNRLLDVRENGVLGGELRDFYAFSAPRIIVFITVTVCVLYALRDLYPGRRFMKPRQQALDVIAANLVALALFYAYFYLSRNVFHPRSIFATVMFFNVVYTLWFRRMRDRLLGFLRNSLGADRHPAILIGAGDGADHVHSLIEVLHPHGTDEAAWVRPSAQEPFEALLRRVDEAARAHDADTLIAADGSFSVAQIMRLLELSGRLGASAKVLSHHLDALATNARVPADSVHGVPLVHFSAPGEIAGKGLRRAVWTAAAAAMLIALAPLLALLALLVRLGSRGPAFFVQERIGVNRQPWGMFKMRTMYDRAAEQQAQVEEFNESGTGLFKIRKDPRVTPVGRFLRRFSLDELPQLVNVLRGEMTLVGPRPLPRRDFENYYEEWHYARHEGMPGLTCLWQVSGRSDLDFHNMCLLDIYYLRNQGWILDLKIILRTLLAVLFAKGAY